MHMSKNGKWSPDKKTHPDRPEDQERAVHISLFESVSARLALMDEKNKRLVYLLLEILGAAVEGDKISSKRLVKLMRVVTPEAALKRQRPPRR